MGIWSRIKRVVLTDVRVLRDRIVAELVPASPNRAATLSGEALAVAVQEGWLTPPLAASGEPPAGAPVASLDELLGELRGDRDGR